MTGPLPVADELAIRNLVARYADATSRRDEAAWRATWAPDCTWDLGGDRVTHGPDEAVTLWRSSIAKYPWVVQMPASGLIEQIDGAARGSWYVLELNHVADGAGVMHLGHYRDCYLKQPDGWRFASRAFHLVYRGAMDPGVVKPLTTS